MNHQRTFVLLGLLALALVACGRQVTPNPPGVGPGGLYPGYMSVKYDTEGAFNFSAYQYFVIFNTTGNGQTPLTNAAQTNWSAYSFALSAGGNGNSTSAQAAEYIFSTTKGVPPYYQQLQTTPVQLQYNPDSNGTGTEFQITFQSIIFTGINATATPSASPSPSTAPSASPSSSPSPAAKIWLLNAFVTQPNSTNAQLQFIDSLGTCGTCFVSPPFNVNVAFDCVLYATVGPTNGDPAAQIVSIEVINNPITATSSSSTSVAGCP